MRERPLRWFLIALAIASRASAVLVLQSHTVPRSTYEHGEIAANLLAGKGFSVKFLGADGPTSQQAPIYPALVAASYALAGVETPRSLLILELAQAALGGVLVAGVLALCGEIAPGRRRVSAAAGLIAALHPTLVYAATHVQVALLSATLLVWSLALAYRIGRTGRGTVIAGLVLGCLILTDPILGLVFPAMFAAIRVGMLRTSHGCRLSRGSRSAAVVLATAVVVISPWIARNFRVHGEFVFVKSTFGYAFWQGNCALSEGTDKVRRASVDRVLATGGGGGLRGLNESLWKARHEAGYLDDIALTKADYALLGAVSEPERSRILLRRALADLRAEPMRYPRLCLRRLRYFLLFDETNPKTRSRVYRAGHLGLTLAALAGLLLAPRDVRRRLGPTLFAAAAIALFHTLTIVSARFHLPIEPLMAVWAACGLAKVGRVGDPSGHRPHFSESGEPKPSRSVEVLA